MLRKALRASRFFLTAAAIFCAGGLFAQSHSAVSVSPLSLPSVSAPTMPTVTAPSIGNDYYVPGSSNFYHGSYPGIRNGLANRMKQTVPPASQDEANLSAQNNPVQSQESGLAAKNSALAGLTASDLSLLSSKGLLGKYSGLLSGNSLAANASGAKDSSDSILLQQILSQLTEMKNQFAGENNREMATSFTQEGKNGSKILRFTLNGQNLLSSCRDVFFSTQESDGSFLLTGDRKYMNEGQNHSETFYLLFRAKGASEGITRYTVTPEVIQDASNSYSSLYQLSQRKGLTAERTGNFISMRLKEADLNLDMLLSMQ